MSQSDFMQADLPIGVPNLEVGSVGVLFACVVEERDMFGLAGVVLYVGRTI